MCAISRLHANEKMAKSISRRSHGSHTIRKGKTGENRRRKVMGLKPKNGQKENWFSPGRNADQFNRTPTQGRAVCQVGNPASVKAETTG